MTARKGVDDRRCPIFNSSQRKELNVSSAEVRLKELAIQLPSVGTSIGNYVLAAQGSGLVFLSGQGPIVDGKVIYEGKVGSDLTEDQGYQAARLAGLNLLAILRAHLGSLDRVRRVLKIVGWVCSAPGFQRQPSVINGASDLITEVFGERGKHARSAVSAHELPLGIAVEVEMVVVTCPLQTGPAGV
ncbi:RidA family protein [Burkholderia multivorans]|uniref:RidA family protein n=1 Tax=Burkholderia multivorans TaxID=87883 RepID=UPI001C2460B7|nr:RidA family protein [Burkholderia multivorans]MBU9480758.1 RidA family protein [Burkholderia multivorans]